MDYLRISPESLSKVEEAGMDFWIVTGEEIVIGGETIPNSDQDFVVRGNGLAAPFEEISGYYSVDDERAMPIALSSLNLRNPVSVAAVKTVSLPPGYTQTFGAHRLLGTVTLRYPAKFYRYTSDPKDRRFSAGTLSKNTYLTTQRDRSFVNTGFGAVGRYALPLPVPASHEHIYTIPKGTTLQVGTVAPNYGQSGGGVEVKTPVSVSVNYIKSRSLDDY